jgi:membrane fusion protein, heavy metal efflux system
MKTQMLAMAILLSFTAGCKKAEETKEAKPATPTPDAAQESSGRLLRIKPEMLRDIRVTTAPVEVRPGGDGVQLLGEMKVNEGRYAEVGTPIACRVISVLVAPSQVVRKGQELAVL